MNCPQCGKENSENRNFCGNCGGTLAAHCRTCGFKNALTDRYCGGCGNPLAEGAAAREARPEPFLPMSMPPAGPPAQGESLYGEKNELTAAAAAELVMASREAAEVVEEKAELQINQSDIDALFGG